MVLTGFELETFGLSAYNDSWAAIALDNSKFNIKQLKSASDLILENDIEGQGLSFYRFPFKTMRVENNNNNNLLWKFYVHIYNDLRKSNNKKLKRRFAQPTMKTDYCRKFVEKMWITYIKMFYVHVYRGFWKNNEKFNWLVAKPASVY